MSIQDDIKTFLWKTGMTQNEFAEVVGVNRSALSHFMRHPGKTIAERVAPYLYGEKRAVLLNAVTKDSNEN